MLTPFVRAMAKDGLSHAWINHTFTTEPSVIALPKYLAAHNYRNPTDSENSPWAYHMGVSFTGYLQANPEIFTHLSGLMKAKVEDTVPWFTTYPVDEMVKGCKPDGAILVDIGGGTGRDIKTLAQHLGSEISPGRLILQDLPSLVGEAKDLPSAVEAKGHDFFGEQPVKGARAYYM